METWRNFTIKEITTAISDCLGSERLDEFVVEMIMNFDLPKEYDASDFENCFAPSRLMDEIELYFSREDLKVIENHLNGISEVPYQEWIDVRRPDTLKQVLESLNNYEMVAFVSRTRSKWSAGLVKDGKIFDFSGPNRGDEIIPQYIMRIDVEKFSRMEHSASCVVKSKVFAK